MRSTHLNSLALCSTCLMLFCLAPGALSQTCKPTKNQLAQCDTQCSSSDKGTQAYSNCVGECTAHICSPPGPSSGGSHGGGGVSIGSTECSNKTYAAAHPYNNLTGKGCKPSIPQNSGGYNNSTNLSGCSNSCGGGEASGVAPTGTALGSPNAPDTNSFPDTGGGVGGGGGSFAPPVEVPKRLRDVKKNSTASARCHDGFYTTTTDRNLACSRHGGIDVWLLPSSQGAAPAKQ